MNGLLLLVVFGHTLDGNDPLQFLFVADLAKLDEACCFRTCRQMLRSNKKTIHLCDSVVLNDKLCAWLMQWNASFSDLVLPWNSTSFTMKSVLPILQRAASQVCGIKFDQCKDLDKFDIASATEALLAKQSKLLEVSIVGCNTVPKDSFVPLLKRIPNLQTFRLVNDHQFDKTWFYTTFAQEMHALTVVELNDVVNVSDALVCRVAKAAPRLQELTVSPALTISDVTLQALSQNCQDLRILTMTSCSSLITDAGVEQLSKTCDKMSTLCLSGTQLRLTHAIYASAARYLPRIQRMEVTIMPVVHAATKHGAIADVVTLLQQRRTLEALRLHWSVLHAVLLRKQQVLLSALHSLVVDGECPPMDSSFPADFAQRLSNLRHLEGTLHPAAANAMLHHMGMHMTQLESVRLAGCEELTSAALIGLIHSNPQLHTLVVHDGYLLTDDVLTSLSRSGNRVRIVDLCQSPALTDAGVESLAAGCPALEVLDASSAYLTDVTLQALVQHSRRLRELRVEGSSDLSPFALLQLGLKCRRLRVLRVDAVCLSELQARGLEADHQIHQLVVERVN